MLEFLIVPLRFLWYADKRNEKDIWKNKKEWEAAYDAEQSNRKLQRIGIRHILH